MGYLRRKIVFYAVALWAAVTLNFAIPRLIKGNPVDIMLARAAQGGQPMPAEARHALELQFGVSDDPLWQQYLGYVGNLLHGRLGLSVTYYPTPVSTVIAQSLPWTLGLAGVALLVTVVLGLGLGMLAGWRRGGAVDALIPATTFLAAIPYFWLALILLYVLGLGLGWFPLNGGYDYAGVQMGPTLAFAASVASHGALPALTVVASSVAGWMLGMRNMMVSTMAEDYVVMAEAKGLSPRRVMLAYAARNAVLPSVAGFAISLGFVVSGLLATEVVFAYPGIGFALLQGVQNADYPLMQGIFLIISLAVLGANLLVDLLYGVIDPRTRKA
ncbi:peptide ABC transporter permease [Sphaerisporangium melleum]|uniref:Peptide ABC transporter permease n=1 Tax=Sphaerisporangium melleum TaxID=321316 RepID=A0A917R1N3_9ACTN|nr:ABC transporter permease [Sphaerisporangium melleum]GGK84854.1 peptide ABC transporter permease [Sphaerisporangium melleum]GII70461.1 peptide ABC transporter permease [Sphaerisporangium melleum]